MQKILNFILTIGNIILQIFVFQYAINTFLPYWGIPINADYTKSAEFWLISSTVLGLFSQNLYLRVIKEKVTVEQKTEEKVGGIITTGFTWFLLWVFSMLFI